MQPYEITVVQVPDLRVASIRGRVPQGDLPRFLGESFDEIYEQLGRLGVIADEDPFVIYHALGPGEIDAEACAPIPHDVDAADPIQVQVLPAATAAETMHIGPYEALEVAYEAMTAWMDDHGYQVAGPIRERYLTGIEEGVSPDEYRTEIVAPIALATSRSAV